MELFSLKLSIVAFVSRALEAIEFLQVALHSNFFGLGCPFHCGPSSIPSLLLALIIGFALGFCACAFLGWIVFQQFFRSPVNLRPRPPSWVPPDWLRGYLYEH